jgi:hypothetical protein
MIPLSNDRLTLDPYSSFRQTLSSTFSPILLNPTEMRSLWPFVLLVVLAAAQTTVPACCPSGSGYCTTELNCRGPKSWSEPSPLANDTCRTCCRNITTELGKCSPGTCINRANCPYDPHPGRGPCGRANGYPNNDIGFALGCCPTSGDPNPIWPHSRAIAFLNINAHAYSFNATCNCPSQGCVSLDGVRSDVVKELARLFPKDADCPFNILAGTEPASEDVLPGVFSHSNGDVITLEDSPCLRAVICGNAPFYQSQSTLAPTPVPTPVPTPAPTKSGNGNGKGNGNGNGNGNTNNDGNGNGNNQDVCFRNGHESCDDYVEFPDRQVLWCRHGTKWEMLVKYTTFSTVDKTLTPFICGDEETLQLCVNQVFSAVDFKGLSVFSEDYGFMLRMARACPNCTNGTSVGVGGPFHVTEAEFIAAKGKFCDDENMLYALYPILGEVNFCQLEYEATTTCLISALTARLTILYSSYFATAKAIPDMPSTQLTMWRQVFPSQAKCPDANFTKVPPPSTNMCRMRIGIILDESQSIGYTNFPIARNALVQFLSSPNLRNSSIISCVTFSFDTKLQFNWTNKTDAAARMAKVPYGYGYGTRTGWGMDHGRTLFPTTNDNAELFIALVVTDGRSWDPVPPHTQATTYLKKVTDRWPKEYIIPFSVGIASAVYTELLQIAQGVPARVLDVRSFDSFAVNIGLVLDRICSISSPVNLTNATNSSQPGQDDDKEGCVKVPVKNIGHNERRYMNMKVKKGERIDLRVKCTSGSMTVYYSRTCKTPGPNKYDAKVSCEDREPVTFDPTPRRKPAWIVQYESSRGLSAHHGFSAQATTDEVPLYMGFVGQDPTVPATAEMLVTPAAARSATKTIIPTTDAPPTPVPTTEVPPTPVPTTTGVPSTAVPTTASTTTTLAPTTTATTANPPTSSSTSSTTQSSSAVPAGTPTTSTTIRATLPPSSTTTTASTQLAASNNGAVPAEENGWWPVVKKWVLPIAGGCLLLGAIIFFIWRSRQNHNKNKSKNEPSSVPEVVPESQRDGLESKLLELPLEVDSPSGSSDYVNPLLKSNAWK